MSAQSLDTYPLRLFAKDMAEIFDISVKRFYALDGEGAFDFARTRPTIGRKSWSRERVRQYFAGEITGLTDGRRRLGRTA